jgi:hypothetical protein
VNESNAPQVVENVSSVSGANARALASNEMGLLLWSAYVQSTDASARLSCAWALARVCHNEPFVLQHIADKVGGGSVRMCFLLIAAQSNNLLLYDQYLNLRYLSSLVSAPWCFHLPHY